VAATPYHDGETKKEVKEMQATLKSNRFPSILVAILFALAVALVLGGTAGYLLKPATFVSGPTHVIVLPASQPGSATTDNACQTFNHVKEC
jgi:hypothetical protein